MSRKGKEVTSRRSSSDREWLEMKLGSRFRILDDIGPFCVELERKNGKLHWVYGRTLDEALSHARTAVERRIQSARH